MGLAPTFRTDGDTKAAATGDALRGTETVLLVEDQDIVRELACRVLQSHGYHVLQAEDGHAALRVIDAHDGPIDLLATDVVMPSMSGGELAQVMQARLPALRVLYMSGYTDDAVLRHRIQHGDLHFLPKPYTPQVLLRKVREIIDQGAPALSQPVRTAP